MEAEDELFVAPKDRAMVDKIGRVLVDYYLSLEASFAETLKHELADGFITQYEFEVRLAAYHDGLFGTPEPDSTD